MAIHPAYAQVSALLTAVFVLIIGNGLSNTLIPLSATAASFLPLSIGLIGSAYFGGMLVGSQRPITDRLHAGDGIVRAVGHADGAAQRGRLSEAGPAIGDDPDQRMIGSGVHGREMQIVISYISVKVC